MMNDNSPMLTLIATRTPTNWIERTEKLTIADTTSDESTSTNQFHPQDLLVDPPSPYMSAVSPHCSGCHLFYLPVNQVSQTHSLYLHEPSAIMYIPDGFNQRIECITKDGQLQFMLSHGLLFPYGIVRHGDTLFITDHGYQRVRVYSAIGGGLLNSISSPVEFKDPCGVTVLHKQLFVADSGNDRIQVFKLDGDFVTLFGGPGSEPGQLQCPTALARSDRYDLLVVLDSGNCRVQVFTSDGVYVRSFGSRGSELTQFLEPRSLTVDSADRIYVTDAGNHRVSIWSLEGEFIDYWGNQGNSRGELNRPTGIAVSQAGHAYVVEQANKRIQVFV